MVRFVLLFQIEMECATSDSEEQPQAATEEDPQEQQVCWVAPREKIVCCNEAYMSIMCMYADGHHRYGVQ